MAASKQWCKENGYTLSEQSFFDSGKSGFKGENLQAKGELKRFLSLVESGRILPGSVLLVENFDRISRLPPVQSIGLFLQIINAGVGVVFTLSYDKRIINTDLLNKDQFILQMVIAECIRAYSESNRKSVLIKASKQAKKQKMQAGEIVPHNNIPKYFTFTNGKYVHNANTEIVKELVKCILSGKSLYAMADSLNQRGVKTFRSGYQWSGNSIRQILRNRVLVGEYLGVKNYVLPIITVDAFNRVQNILNQNKFNRGKKGEISNIFRGICFCADPECGHTMSVAAQYKDYKTGEDYKTPYRYLRCSVLGKHSECKNRGTFRLDDLEQEFFVNFLFKNPTKLLNENDNKEMQELDKAITTAQARLNKINSEIQKIVSLLADVPLPELKTKLTALNKERDTLKTELDNLNSKKLNIQDSPHTVDHLKKLLGPGSNYKSKFKIGKDGIPLFERDELDTAIEAVIKSLKDEYVREGIRVMLPSLIGKITVDTVEGRFYVYNRMGKMIFKSFQYESKRNNSAKWDESLKRYTKRRLKSGRIITLKRKEYAGETVRD
jgi:hypothetical protein